MYVPDYNQGLLWKIALDGSTEKVRLASGLSGEYGITVLPHSGPGQPEIKTPQSNQQTGDRPDFTGNILPPVPAGTTIHATEGSTVIAESVHVAEDGTWIFDAGLPWVPATHTVTVTATP